MPTILIAPIVLYNLALCIFVVQVVRCVIGTARHNLRHRLATAVAAVLLVLIPVATWASGVVSVVAHYDARPPIALSIIVAVVGSLLCWHRHGSSTRDVPDTQVGEDTPGT
jgi:hypothetical protein